MDPRFSANGHSASVPTLDSRKQALVARLKGKYARINKELEDAIEWCREIPVLDGAEIVILPYDDGRYDTLMAYRKEKGEWSIFIGDRDNAWDAFDEQDFGWKPVLECAMEIKVLASEKLDELKEAVLRVGQEFLDGC